MASRSDYDFPAILDNHATILRSDLTSIEIVQWRRDVGFNRIAGRLRNRLRTIRRGQGRKRGIVVKILVDLNSDIRSPGFVPDSGLAGYLIIFVKIVLSLKECTVTAYTWECPVCHQINQIPFTINFNKIPGMVALLILPLNIKALDSNALTDIEESTRKAFTNGTPLYISAPFTLPALAPERLP